MTRLLACAVISAAAAAAVACGRPASDTAETTPPLATPETAPETVAQASNTSAFVSQLATGAVVEVESSRIAAARSRNDSVKQFARTLITEGEATRSELERIAQELGAPLLTLDSASMDAIERVRQADAESLDARYLDVIINARQTAIDEVERYAQYGESADLRAWARESLPTMRVRLQEADVLRQAANTSSG
jgi:putative membrane protein